MILIGLQWNATIVNLGDWIVQCDVFYLRLHLRLALSINLLGLGLNFIYFLLNFCFDIIRLCLDFDGLSIGLGHLVVSLDVLRNLNNIVGLLIALDNSKGLICWGILCQNFDVLRSYLCAH